MIDSQTQVPMPPVGSAIPAALLQAVLDGLEQAVVVLDAQGGLAYWNHAARRRLHAVGWALDDGRLVAHERAVSVALSRALHSACALGRMSLLALSSSDQVGHAALAPVQMQGRRWAMLLLDREKLCGAIEMQLFAAGNGLTLAESRVLAQLVHGLRPAQIAREHGVSSSTVLSQVAALRAKTQSTSIVNLLARLSRLPTLQAVSVGGSRPGER